ncbi:MAG: MBL fold metallo-hydrolase [Candidatus Paceibacterota bacterium]
MRIKWYGQSFFRIVFGGRGGTRIVTDPYSSDCGLDVPTIKSHIMLVSHPDYNNTEAVREDPFVVDAPGEYEMKSTFVKAIRGRNTEEDKTTMFRIEAEGYSIIHLGDFGQEELEQEQMEALGSVDVLLIPIGGGRTIGPSDASKLVTQVEPKAVIPMRYDIPNLNEELEELDDFLEAMGEEDEEPQEKFEVKATNLPEDDVNVVVLKPDQ